MLTSVFLFLMMQAPAAPQPAEQPAPAAQARAAAPAPASELLQIRYVYLLPMSSSFDQYLANHLTRSGVFQVVTDPAKADAIFTDRLGHSFEARMEELYPTPKPEEKMEKPPKPEEGEAPPPSSETFKMPLAPQDRLGGSGKSKGTYFLVHRSTRNVVWSIYNRMPTGRADDINDTAKDVVERLQSAVKSEGKAASGKKGWHPW